MQWLIPILVFVCVIAIGGAVLAVAAGRRRSLKTRLQLAGGEETEVAAPAEAGIKGMVGRVGTAVSQGKTSRSLREELAAAGYHGTSTAAIYIGAKLILSGFGLVAGLLLVLLLDLPRPVTIFIGLLVTGVLFLVPNLVVSLRRRSRRSEVRLVLPDVVDLLEICVSAGMGIDAAWQSVADEMRSVSQTVSEEMSLAQLEMHLGAKRTDALRHMAERTGADELASLVGMLVQSDRFGTSVSDALRTFANSMREARSHKAEEEAEKTAVKLLFPLVIFIFPAMLIVLAGPAVLTLKTIMK